MRYFHIRGQSGKSAVITVPQGFDQLPYWADLEASRSDSSWVPPPTRALEGPRVDWAPSNLYSRLCSEKLRRILDGFSDTLVWLPVPVETSHGEVLFFILHFTEFGDVIDPDKSNFVAGRLFRAHLASSKVGQRRIFAIQPLSSAAIVN